MATHVHPMAATSAARARADSPGRYAGLGVTCGAAWLLAGDWIAPVALTVL